MHAFHYLTVLVVIVEMLLTEVAVTDVRVLVVAVMLVAVDVHSAPHITKQCSLAKSPISPRGSLQSDFRMREPHAGASLLPWHTPG